MPEQLGHYETSRCEARERDGSICGEPILVGRVCYDHAKLGPGDQPLCPLTGEWPEGPPTSVRDWERDLRA